MKDKDFERRLAKARERVKDFDKADGFADRELRTIASALECGIKKPNTDAAFDALVMLNDLIKIPTN